jgi:hypothetical protein
MILKVRVQYFLGTEEPRAASPNTLVQSCDAIECIYLKTKTHNIPRMRLLNAYITMNQKARHIYLQNTSSQEQ